MDSDIDVEKRSVLSQPRSTTGSAVRNQDDDTVTEKRSVLTGRPFRTMPPEENTVTGTKGVPRNDDTVAEKRSVLAPTMATQKNNETLREEHIAANEKRSVLSGRGGGMTVDTEEDATATALSNGINGMGATHLEEREANHHGTVSENQADEKDEVVPVATLVSQKSVKMAEAIEADTSCVGRLGRRGCLFLIGVQLLVAAVVAVVVVVLLVGGGEGNETEVDASITLSPVTTSPTNQPTAVTSNFPSLFPSSFPSTNPTTFPEPDECLFRIEALDPIITIPETTEIPRCQFQPYRLEFLFLGGSCADTAFCLDEFTECEDFLENGVIPREFVAGRFRIILNGMEMFASLYETVVFENGGNDLPLFNVMEIYRDEPPYNETTTLLQRVRFRITCNNQPLCFRNVGPLSISKFENDEQGFVGCLQTVEVDPLIFPYTISIPPKLPQDEDTAIVFGVTVSRDGTVLTDNSIEDQPIFPVEGLTNVSLTTSNRTLRFAIEAYFFDYTDYWVPYNFTSIVLVTGETSTLGLPCFALETFTLFYDPPEGPPSIGLSGSDSECPT